MFAAGVSWSFLWPFHYNQGKPSPGCFCPAVCRVSSRSPGPGLCHGSLHAPTSWTVPAHDSSPYNQLKPANRFFYFFIFKHTHIITVTDPEGNIKTNWVEELAPFYSLKLACGRLDGMYMQESSCEHRISPGSVWTFGLVVWEQNQNHHNKKTQERSKWPSYATAILKTWFRQLAHVPVL